jgi:hypothetical protein
MVMNSVSLVTYRASREQLAVAQQHASSTGGSIFVVPSAAPNAPGPFDFTKSSALSDAAYRCTRTWLEDLSASQKSEFDVTEPLST